MRTDLAPPVRLADYRVPDHLVDTVHLHVSLDRTATRVTARLAIRPNPLGVLGAPLVLNGEDLTLATLALDGATPSTDEWRVSADGLKLARPPARPFVLEIVTTLDPTKNLSLMGLYRSGSAYCTQCEAEGFRRITYFPDRPDVLSTYTVRIEADRDDAPVLLSNGNLVEAGALETAAAISRCGTTRIPSPATSSRWSAAPWARSTTPLSPAPAAAWRSASMSSPARKSAPATRWTR